MPRRFVVVSGLPGSGKSTIARRIGAGLNLDVIDKDDLLEQSFEGVDVISSAERQRLSRLADETMTHLAQASAGAVIVSFWRREQLSATAGTPTSWLHELPHVVEVHCVCSPSTAVQRFIARHRHHGHGDQARSAGDLAAQFIALDALGPIGIGPLVTVDTTQEIRLAELLEQLATA